MTDTQGKTLGRQLVRLAWLTLGLAPVVLTCIVTYFWVRSNVPRWVYWKIGLILMFTAEIAYIAALVLAIPGAVVTGAALIWRRGERNHRLTIARWFLLCTSVVFALAMAEVASAMWQCQAHKASVMPVGGLRSLPDSDPSTRVSLPAREVELPTAFPDPPGDRELDVVVVGESSAEGVPYQNWLSIGQIVKWQLNEIIPDRPIRLQIVAKGGENLEHQHRRLASLERRPDLLIIYCGHNEFQSRFRAMRDLQHYFDDQQPSLREILVDRVERLSPLCGLIHEASEKCRIGIPPSSESPRRLIDVPAYTTLEYLTLLADFRRRLEAMTSYAERVGAIPVLILPPANDAGFEPNRSFLPAGAPRAEREAFEREFLAIRASESSDPRGCIERYRAMLGRQSGFAEAHYRLAQLLKEAGDRDEAYQHYVASRDLDGYPIRAPSAFQEAYRDVARRHGCILIDGQSLFHAIGTHGMLDDSLFQDAMHPSLRGYIALAQAVLQALQARRTFDWPQDLPAPIIDPARCATHFGLGRDTWKHLCIWGKGFNELMAPLRYDPSTRHRQRELNLLAMERLDAGFAPDTLGLPNLGIPERVPLVPASGGDSAPQAHRSHP
jgi:lysophospholipase L1-like esterase